MMTTENIQKTKNFFFNIWIVEKFVTRQMSVQNITLNELVGINYIIESAKATDKINSSLGSSNIYDLISYSKHIFHFYYSGWLFIRKTEHMSSFLLHSMCHLK
jgi:hypothetical protein